MRSDTTARHGRRRPRATVLLAVALCALGFLALASGGEAWAHGGRVAPRPPAPPETPPPPPPSQNAGKPRPTPPTPALPVPFPTTPIPPVPSPGIPTPIPSPVTPANPPSTKAPPPTTQAPTAPPSGRPPTRPPARTSPRGRRASSLPPDLESQWQTWWSLNRLGFLPDRTAALRFAVITPREGEENDLRAGWSRRRVFVGDRHVVPFLRRLVDPKRRSRSDVVASALIALGKISQEPDVTDLFLHHLTDRRAAPIVRESAALAIGLQARSDPELRRDPAELDALRDHLLAAYDDGHMPYQARVFAAVALGLLGDQPFSAPYAKDGRLVVRALWRRLEKNHAHEGMTVALLTALGMQPSAGVPDGVRAGLRAIVSGRRVLSRRWSPAERSYALAAALRLGGPGAYALLRRTVARNREHVAVRRAAYVSLGHLADTMTPAERLEIAALVLEALGRDRDPLTSGLGQLALGHLFGADLRAGQRGVLVKTRAVRELLAETKNGPTPTRGFSVLALALAVRDVEPVDAEIGRFVADAQRLILRQLERGRGDDRMRAAHAVAAGLAGLQEARDLLVGIVKDRRSDPELRGHAAVALGQLGKRGPDVQQALFGALAQRRYAELRRQAALGLALLGGRAVGTRLLSELEQGDTELMLSSIVMALGRLGDLGAVDEVVAYAANDGRSELAQALAVVALGILCDPEPRPSLLRLTQDANYPARTSAMTEAYNIL